MNNTKLRKILLTVENGFIDRNIIRSGIFDTLRRAHDAEIVLLVPKERHRSYSEEFGSSRVVVEVLPEEQPKNKFETFLYYAMINSVPTHTQTIKQYIKLYNAEYGSRVWRVTLFLCSRTVWYLGHIVLWRKFLRLLYWYLPSRIDQYTALFREHRPDLVFATNLLRFDEFRMVKAARKLGIGTVSVVLSWDNLSSKLFLALIPDQLIVYNQRIAEEASRIHDVPPGRMFISGIPQYDYYFRFGGNEKVTREEFFQMTGGDSTKKTILYACSSKPTSPNYKEVFMILRDAFKKEPSVQVLIRPYPKYPLTEDVRLMLKEFPNAIVDKAMLVDRAEGEEWSLAKDHNWHAANSFYHSDVVVSTFSTFQIEAAIFNKPIVNINFDGRENKPYHNSIRRYMDYTQYKGFIEKLWMHVVSSPDKLGEVIMSALENPNEYAAGRRKVVEEQCLYLDGRAGERIGKFLLSLFA